MKAKSLAEKEAGLTTQVNAASVDPEIVELLIFPPTGVWSDGTPIVLSDISFPMLSKMYDNSKA